jgi:antirestriction protein ArdC
MTERTNMTKAARADLYTRVTEKIIADLNQGVRPWIKPWSAGRSSGDVSLPLRHTGEPYRGINILLLWSEAIQKGYQSARWMTYRQALELGGHVRKGEAGSQVVYANSLSMKSVETDGSVNQRDVYLLRAYTVFNTDQIDGLPDEFTPGEPPRDRLSLNDAAERFVAATKATIRHGGDHAYYTESGDAIQLPHPNCFTDAESYAATQLHELIHWTKHASRLDRHFESHRYAYKGYSREELVAELGAAFLCAALGVTPEPREDHAAYISHWLRILEEDRRAVFTAAAHAQRAVDYLQALQPSGPE